MDENIVKWLKRFRQEWDDKPIEYLDESGEWQQDHDPLFSSISSEIQARDHRLSVEELLKISQWKLQSGRNNDNIRQNTSEVVTRQLRTALEAETDARSIETLTELNGVGVPMASTILGTSRPV